MKTQVVIMAKNHGLDFKSGADKALSKVNFKHQLTYVLNAVQDLGKPVVLTDDTARIADVYGDAVSFEMPENAENILFIDACMPLITKEDITNFLEFHFAHNNAVTKAGEGLKAVKNGADKVADGIIFNEITDNFIVCSSRKDIPLADSLLRDRICDSLMEKGVTIINPDSTYIEEGVEVGMDTVIYPGCVLEGTTKIGENCILYPNCAIKNCVIGNNTEIKSSTLMDSTVGSDTTVGPYAYVRPDSEIGSHVKVGDFVEVKKSKIGDGTKISHLTYVGDSVVGKNVNFGCGTVTVNYDGKNKFTTEIGDGAFIGCNTNLVAPVKVGNGAFIAAGSTITDEIPEEHFAIARSRQTTKSGWVKPKDK